MKIGALLLWFGFLMLWGGVTSVTANLAWMMYFEEPAPQVFVFRPWSYVFMVLTFLMVVVTIKALMAMKNAKEKGC